MQVCTPEQVASAGVPACSFSFCRPSRGPTSTMRTCDGNSWPIHSCKHTGLDTLVQIRNQLLFPARHQRKTSLVWSVHTTVGALAGASLAVVNALLLQALGAKARTRRAKLQCDFSCLASIAGTCSQYACAFYEAAHQTSTTTGAFQGRFCCGPSRTADRDAHCQVQRRRVSAAQ